MRRYKGIDNTFAMDHCTKFRDLYYLNKLFGLSEFSLFLWFISWGDDYRDEECSDVIVLGLPGCGMTFFIVEPSPNFNFSTSSIWCFKLFFKVMVNPTYSRIKISGYEQNLIFINIYPLWSLLSIFIYGSILFKSNLYKYMWLVLISFKVSFFFDLSTSI